MTSLLRSIYLYFTTKRQLVKTTSNTTSIYTTLKKQNNSDKVKNFLKENDDKSFIQAIDSVSKKKELPLDYFEIEL